MTRAIPWVSALLLLVSTARADIRSDLEVATEAIHAWDMVTAEAAIARLHGEAPSDPRVQFVLGHQRLMQGRYEEAVTSLTRAVAAGAQGMAPHLLDIARKTLEATGNYVSHPTADGRFVVRHAPGLDEIMVPLAEEVLSAAWANLTPRFDMVPSMPIQVDIYPRAEVLAQVSSLTVEEIETSGTIALCKYNRLMITSPRDLVYGYDWAHTLAHEFIHLLITKRSRNTVPIWLHEGLAKYYEAWRVPDGKPRLDRYTEDLLARALRADTLIPFGDMSPSMAKLPSQEATATAFAEVFTAIGYLRERAGDDLAPRLLDAMAQGKSDREAVEVVTGKPFDRFESAWRQHLRRMNLRTLDDAFDMRLLFKGQHTEADELEAVQGETARRFVWLGDRLRMKKRYAAAAKEYGKAIAEVGDSTPYVQAKLGFVLLRLGRLTEAIQALSRPLSLYPDYVLLRLYLGEATLRSDQLEQAKGHLEHAILLNPFDPDVHDHLAKVYERLGLDERAARERKAHGILHGR